LRGISCLNAVLFLLFFHQTDFDGDGTLSWEDFNLMAEKYAVYQRKGEWDEEVVANWRKVAKKWWDSLYAKADVNQVVSQTFCAIPISPLNIKV
jgi:hypothetical protein